MTLRMAPLASMLLLPMIAEAQSVQGLYINVDTGLNITDSMLSSKETTRIDTNPGPLGLVDLGWRFGGGLRVAIEGSYRSNDISGISTHRANGTLQPLGNTTGSDATYAAMANVVYDVRIHPFGLPISPYVGAGFGYGWLDFGDGGGVGYGTIPAPQNSRYTGPLTIGFGSAGAFAYQAMVGAAIPLGFLPRLDVTLEYRFFGMARADVPVNRTAANTTNLINGVVPSSETHNGFEVHDNAILIGLRYSFGGP